MTNVFNIVNSIYLSEKMNKEKQMMSVKKLESNMVSKMEPIGSPLKKTKSSERLRRIRSEEDFVKFQIPWIL